MRLDQTNFGLSIAAIAPRWRRCSSVRFRHAGVRFRTGSVKPPRRPRRLHDQGPRRSRPPPSEIALSVRNGTPLTMDDAVRMALENNLGIQEERLQPAKSRSYGGRARASAYTPALFSSRPARQHAAPPTDFLSTGGAVVTSGGIVHHRRACSSSCRSAGQLSGHLDGSRGDDRRAAYERSTREPGVAPERRVQPAAAAQLQDRRATRQQLLIARTQQKIADLAASPARHADRRVVRDAYYNLIGAIGGLDVAQQSLDLSRQSLKDNRTPRRGRHDGADRHRRGAEAEVASNEETVIVAEAAIQTARGSAADADHEPLAARISGRRAFRTDGSADADAAGHRRRAAAIKNALANRHRHPAGEEATSRAPTSASDFAQNQRLPEVDLQARLRRDGRRRHAVQLRRPTSTATPRRSGSPTRSFGDALRDVFGQRLPHVELRAQRQLPDRHQPGRGGGAPRPAAAQAGATSS